MITAAARALAAGDALGALQRVALRKDAPALALRGIAMAQLGDFPRAKVLLRRAARAYGSREAVARARCTLAEAEVALASRDLGWPAKALAAALSTLESHHDRANAAHARHLQIRHLLLLGRIDAADQMLTGMRTVLLPHATRALHELLIAGVATRRLHAQRARAALARAGLAAGLARIPALVAEVETARLSLDTPVARLAAQGDPRALLLDEVETLLASPCVVIDACRRLVHVQGATASLAKRPVLFALVRALGEAWPKDVAREVLIAQAFRLKLSDESQRARLRVQIGRLRTALRPLIGLRATPRGFELVPRRGYEVFVLTPAVDEPHAAVLALLADGEAWSSSALALALEVSQRSAQRALDTLRAAARVHATGRGRARRWMMPPSPQFATALLLPGSLPDALG
jgi:tetratricopeptide (TPR) repeat protein